MRWVLRYLTNERGTSAAEFAMVVIPFFALVFAILGGSFVLYTNMTMQNAAEAAARCASINANLANGNSSCVDSNGGTNIQSYAQSHYYGIVPVTWSYSEGGCGHTVSGRSTNPYNLNLIVTTIPVNFQANACFP